jgi:outer membrane protein TolC
MTRKVLALITFAFLSRDLGVAQQVEAPLTVQAPAIGAKAQNAGSAPVVLDELVREALQKNPAVQSALHAVEAQRRRVPQAKSLPDPTVGVGWMGNARPFSVQTGDPSSYRVVSAMQMLPYPGKLRLGNLLCQ